MENNEQFNELQGKDSVKLVKNTKGYNYEVKIYALNSNEVDEKDLLRLRKIEAWLKKNYGDIKNE